MSRACIPFHILFDKELSKNELIIYGLIENMESNGRAVFFNNRTIAEKLGVSHESRIVGKMLQKLREKNYIQREHKEVLLKDRKGNIKKVMRWCLSTVKNTVISNEYDDENMVPEIPPLTMVPEIPPLTMVPEVPQYINPLTTNPLTTTTDSSSSFSPFENKCLEFKNASDERTSEEFLENVHHHIKLNSDSDCGEHQKQQMILKLLRKLHKSPEHFLSRGYVSNETIKEESIKNENHIERLLWSAYQGYVKSPLEIGLRQKGVVKLEPFEVWRKKVCIE